MAKLTIYQLDNKVQSLTRTVKWLSAMEHTRMKEEDDYGHGRFHIRARARREDSQARMHKYRYLLDMCAGDFPRTDEVCQCRGQLDHVKLMLPDGSTMCPIYLGLLLARLQDFRNKNVVNVMLLRAEAKGKSQ